MVSIYPNPTTDFSQIETNNFDINEIQIVYLQGRIVINLSEE